MAAISYDSVEILKDFSDRAGIGFPLLADPDHAVIDAFGIVNDSVPEDSGYYGFAYAGYYVIDKNGVVISKFFNEANNNRTTSASILVREFGDPADSRQGEAETDHLVVRWSASNETYRPGQRGVLVLDVEPKPGWHVYAPEVEGYIPVSWTMIAADGKADFAGAKYPASKSMHLPAIGETVPVYDRAFRALRDVRVEGRREFPPELRGREALVVEGTFRYQACDDERCDFPVTVPLKWTLKLQDHDLERVPEALRRQ